MIKISEQEKNCVNNAYEVLHGLEEAIEVDSYHLRERFYARRIELQEEAQKEADLNASHTGKASKKIWCSLHLAVRVTDGSLQIYWHTMHHHRVTKKKKYGTIPKGATNSYDLRKLSKHAEDFEWDLVKETEQDAAVLRAKWKNMVGIRAMLKSFVGKPT